MDLPGCETTVKSINNDPSPHLEATKERVREPGDEAGRMTHFGQHQQQHLLLRMLPGTSNPRASRRSRSLGVMTYLCRKGLGTVLSYPSFGTTPFRSLRALPAPTLYRHRFFFPLYFRSASSLVCNSGDVGQDVLISHGIICPRARFALELSSCAPVAVVMFRVLRHLELCRLAVLVSERVARLLH